MADEKVIALRRYVDLIEKFLAGSLTAIEFETDYLRLFKNEPTFFSEEVYWALDTLFGDVDEFDVNCPESEAQLREACKKALERIK